MMDDTRLEVVLMLTMVIVINFMTLILIELASVYFISDIDSKNRIRSLKEFSEINLNEIRRAKHQALVSPQSLNSYLWKMISRSMVVVLL